MMPAPMSRATTITPKLVLERMDTVVSPKLVSDSLSRYLGMARKRLKATISMMTAMTILIMYSLT